ncbi:His Kinase A (phospho-acceptor) domain-containing protein [Amycolatopsis marina]|uniref:histidine kinase n=1 Tax=Amycolatopsis marina TaxID=490629 RepID=A0A1I1AHI1_9PSEU|nr:HAMP domain-containing sensor histidine kinase [Amycolatopsis marina]SFB35958.1 His Kinase A (phospho-acceptor) domain-containing protein [Amycolatopsis marina]
MKGSAADRLRRLRLLLTLLFTVLNAAGLVVLAWLVIQGDGQQRDQQLDGELRRVTSTVLRLVGAEGAIVTAYIGEDQINTQCPQFAVLPGAAGQFTGHVSARTCVPVDIGVLSFHAENAALSGRILSGYIRGSNGELVRIAAEPFRNDNGQYVGAVVAAADARAAEAAHDRLILWVVGGCVLLVAGLGVTGHVLAGRAIRPATAALEQQETLLAETAHDLRTPVAALRALAETALRNPAERPDLLPRTVRLAARMGGIIDGLLVRARLAAGVEMPAIQPVWLDQLVTGVVEETPTDGAQVTVTTAPTQVNVDPALMQRAIGNLLDNALRYGRQPNSAAIVHITVAGGRVTVADHGPGIDAAVAKETFDRFSSGGGSSGLGLSIVRWVAQAHGGVLRVYNAEEGGAIFELVLPENGGRL